MHDYVNIHFTLGMFITGLPLKGMAECDTFTQMENFVIVLVFASFTKHILHMTSNKKVGWQRHMLIEAAVVI